MVQLVLDDPYSSFSGPELELLRGLARLLPWHGSLRCYHEDKHLSSNLILGYDQEGTRVCFRVYDIAFTRWEMVWLLRHADFLIRDAWLKECIAASRTASS
jgi:hypothetical protein